ncbi:unnamed protein product [Mytilus edulis]|uniref:Uncharacterized protein n=1 Tax=Mytilus edulis TaxID=6550 RepID=A0A8S3TLN2_MYTED|nr:unnamed protein product [Mytilus edulis]
MSWIIFIHINAICLQAVTAYDMKLGYLINDGNASYKREMEINQEMNILKIHTLAHHEVLESYSMQNFQKGQQITCIPSVNQSRFRENKSEHNADTSLIMETFRQSLLNEINSISRAHTHTTIGRELFHVDKDEMVDPSILEGDLRAFYHGFGFPLYKEKKIQDDAKILNNRSIKAAQEDLMGKWVFPDCDNVSVNSPHAYMCICCPYVTYIVTTRNDCVCTRMGRGR